MAKWPADNEAALIAFYGNPASAVASQLVKVVPPFRMTYDGKALTHLSFHRLAAPALERALKTVWEYYGRDQSKIDALGISKTAGTYNKRKISGSDKWSNHAYGAAIDINAEENGFYAAGNIPIPMIAAFKAEGARWGGDYKNRTDPMHFEFCASGEPVRTFEQWLAFYGAPAGANTTGEPMPSNFERVHPLIAKWEGGYSNDPQDAGGPTNFGITQERLSESRGRQVSAAEVQALTYEEALQIFKRYYWAPLRCDEMPIALATMTYNTGVNSGPSRGARFLQQVLNKQGAGLEEDGAVGPLTIKAARECPDITKAVRDYSAIYEAYYRSLGNFARFGAGWLNRLNDITPQALAWANEPAPPINGEVLPPITESEMETDKIVAAVLAALEARGVIPPAPAPKPIEPPPATGQGFDINQLLPLLLQTPVGQKLIGGQAATLMELLPLVQQVMALAQGKPVAALPAPAAAPVATAPATPATPAMPAAAPATGWTNFQAGLAGVVGSLGLSAAGVIGAPVGETATMTGMLLPLLSIGAAALGIPAPVVNIVSTLWGRLFPTATPAKTS